MVKSTKKKGKSSSAEKSKRIGKNAKKLWGAIRRTD